MFSFRNERVGSLIDSMLTLPVYMYNLKAVIPNVIANTIFVRIEKFAFAYEFEIGSFSIYNIVKYNH